MFRFKEDDFTLDFYARLGVARDASTLDIAQAYKKRAVQVHPDKNPDDPAAHGKFVALGRAYECLKDEASRRLYDQNLETRNKPDTTVSSIFKDTFREKHFYARYQYTGDEFESYRRAYNYTDEDINKYKEASARLGTSNYRSGDLSTTFNFLAGSSRANKKQDFLPSPAEKLLPPSPPKLPGRGA